MQPSSHPNHLLYLHNRPDFKALLADAEEGLANIHKRLWVWPFSPALYRT